MLLLADFGNTRVKIAVCHDHSLETVYCGPSLTGDIRKSLDGMAIDGGMWCAVRPIENDLREWLTSKGVRPLTHDTPVPIRIGYATPRTLGLDRVAAAVGAWSSKPGCNLLVIDAGTALTVDFVSADGEFRGGNIAPGIGVRLKSLHEFTGALPMVSAQGDIPVMGYDTETAIRSGVINGIRHEVEGYIQLFNKLYPSVFVFLTGGDAGLFDIKGKSTIFATPDLVISGLYRIVEFNEKIL